MNPCKRSILGEIIVTSQLNCVHGNWIFSHLLQKGETNKIYELREFLLLHRHSGHLSIHSILSLLSTPTQDLAKLLLEHVSFVEELSPRSPSKREERILQVSRENDIKWELSPSKTVVQPKPIDRRIELWILCCIVPPLDSSPWCRRSRDGNKTMAS